MEKIICNKSKIIIILIFIVAILSRIYLWPNTIDDINCDEAMTAINAKAISETGCDMYGTRLPVYFETWLFGGQSAFLTYFMALCIKIFGFNIFAIRLPMLIISLLSIFVFYKLVNIIFENKNITIISLAILVINPWHIMQSLWSLDCNMFPHLFLVSLYLFAKSIKLKKHFLLYLSMIFFGITTYTYGVALYFVPIFLVSYMIIALKNKELSWKNVTISALIVCIVAFPLILMSIINIFKLNSINIGPITIPFFEYFSRNKDMIFYSENIIKQFFMNFIFIFSLILYNYDGLIWNAIKGFGTIYTGSIILAIVGIYSLFKKTNIKKQYKRIIICWLVASLGVGLIINNVNINRLNIIWYPIIILTSYGIYNLVKMFKNKKSASVCLFTIFTICFLSFEYTFYKVESYNIENSDTWSKGFIKTLNYAKNLDESVIIDRSILNNYKNITFYIYNSDYNFKTNGFLSKDLFLYIKKYDADGNVVKICELCENSNLDKINNNFLLIDIEESFKGTCILEENKLNELSQKNTYKELKKNNNYYIIKK